MAEWRAVAASARELAISLMARTTRLIASSWSVLKHTLFSPK